ncbi:hypothetical protein CCACVL1_01318, partial [Corchorus capsularis]
GTDTYTKTDDTDTYTKTDDTDETDDTDDTNEPKDEEPPAEVALIRYSEQPDFRRDIIRGSMRVQRRKTVISE